MRGLSALLGVFLCAAAFSASAGAAVPESLGIAPEDGKPGAEAGQVDFPLAVAAEGGLPGHIFVSTNSNNRIDELTPWGEFVKAWGWGVDKSAPAEELQVCTEGTGCKKGSAGSGAGQISGAEAIALGPVSDLYVAESANHRVQRFGLDGHFISTFGDGVNKTAIEEGRSGEEDVCPAAGHPADVCQAGVAGSGPGQLGAASYVGRLAVCGGSGRVFVGEGERIQVFSAGGAFQEAIALPAGESVTALTIDPACNLYAAMGNEVRKLKPNGPTAEFLTPTFEAESNFKEALAIDPAGNLYGVVFPGGGLPERVLEFEPKEGKCLVCGADGEGGKSGFDRPSDGTALWAIAATAACGTTDFSLVHFGNGSEGPLLSYVNILGPPPDTALCPQPPGPPKIEGTHAVAVGTGSARVAAAINPRFWPDTTYRVQYGTSACSEGGCQERPPEPGAILTSKIIRAALPAEVPLSGLAPATTYHYRFVAESGGGGPVIGEEKTFTTLPSPAAPKEGCSNKAFRAGPSANLPDCRAYEMVSPVDKANGDIFAPGELAQTDRDTNGATARVDQAAGAGGAFTYSSARAFGDALSSPWTSQYIARRGEEGWDSHSLNPPREGPTLYLSGLPNLESPFKGFGEDLCSGWVMQDTDLALAPGAPKGVPMLYRERNCGAGGYEALITTPPAGFSKALEGIESHFAPTLQGFSQDGSIAALKAPGKLTEASTRTVVGESLDCGAGASAKTTSTYAWLRNGVLISSAAKPTYVAKKADEGKALQCQVKTSNEDADDGTGGFVGVVQTSVPAEVVAPYPPQAPPRPPAALPAPSSDAPLTIGGGGGQTLSCDAEEGQWSGSPTSLAYQWYRNGTSLVGKTEPTYLVSVSDVASSAAFQCAVTATNSGGATTRVSEIVTTTGPVPQPPAPVINPIVNDVYEAYLSSEGALALVSVLPGGQAAGSHASIGTAQSVGRRRLYDSVAGAVSGDGSRVFWSAELDQIHEAEPKTEDPANPVHIQGPPDLLRAGELPAQVPRALYLRFNAGREQSALVHATGTGSLEKGKTVVKGVASISGAFAPGQAITGVGIPAGTMIEKVSGTELTLSREALETKPNAALDAVESCSDEVKACTIQIASGSATFLGADPKASEAIYTEGAKLYELDVDKAIEDGNASTAKTPIAGEVLGVVGTSTDLSHVYVVSKEVCSSDPNSHGDEAQPGKANLYLYQTGESCEAGELDFVATLSGHNDVGAYTPVPVNHRSRVTPDGLHAAFMSQAPLTSFDSTDAASGKADSEVFLYDAPGAPGGGEGGQLRCASCNATGALPTGRDLRSDLGEFWVAAMLPGWENEWHPGRVLSEDGSRLYFESSEPLVSRDTNGAQDVYQWERAANEKECLEGIGGELFLAQSGGCLSLISPGKGSRDAEFLDATPSGSDVFITTVASLVPKDPGLVDIYDAREGGGLPSEESSVKRCEGESCQPPSVAPQDSTPASATFEGQGNIEEVGKRKRGCPKGKHRVRRGGKQRCVPRAHKRGKGSRVR